MAQSLTPRQTIGSMNGQDFFVGGTTAPVMTADSLARPRRQAQLPPPVVPTQPNQFVNNLQPAIKQGNEGLIQANTREAEQRNDVLNNLLRIDSPNSQQTYDNRFKGLGGEDFLKQFTDANTRLAQLQGVFNTGSQKVSSAPGQSQVFEGLQLNEVSRQKAVEVGNAALVVQAMQGNIQTARQIALDTTRFASEDRQARLSSLINQFNSLDGIVQGQEKQLIDSAKAKAEQEYNALIRVQDNIDTAITSGGASVEEMQQLIRNDISDEEKMTLAQTIIGRIAAEDRMLSQRVVQRGGSSGGRASSGSRARGSSSSSSLLNFTDTQLAKGAAAAGMSIEDFITLPEDEQNNYINGEKSKWEGGNLPESEYADLESQVQAEIDGGTGLGEIRALIDDMDIAQADKETLKQYAEDNQPGFFSKLLKKLNPFD